MFPKSQSLLKLSKNIIRLSRKTLILGIETSCDDTGVAVIDLEGNILSEFVESQIQITSSIGGIIPTVARQLHLFNIDPTVKKVMNNINISFKDLSAIALTVKPGLPLSLAIGRDYAVAKAKENNLPIIPVHHMEAHALTVRMFDRSIGFPFLVLLISGGNSLLGLAHDVETFSTFGTRCDISPGDCLDKIARMMHLVGKLGSHTGIPGGKAIELFANDNVDELIDLTFYQSAKRNCNFSFSGLEGAVYEYLRGQRRDGNTLNLPRLSASVLYCMAFQMCRKLQRAIIFCRSYIDPPPNILVVSGGVASNLFFRASFQRVCDENDYRLICPPIEYCTDNGAMIAWNGYELHKLGKRIVRDVRTIDYKGRAPFGDDRIEEIANRNIPLPKLKIRDLFIKNK